MNRHRLLAAIPALALSALCLAAWPAHAQSPAPAEAGGVRYEPTVMVAGSTLQLNGLGIRYKFVKVYTAGLYLAAKATTPEAALAAPGAKRIHIVMLRDIDGNELGKLFTRGMQDNAPKDEFIKAIPGTIRMGEIFATRRKLVSGDSFSVDYVPGTGTTVRVNGQPVGEVIREPEFYTSLLRIWLGKSPADPTLRDALLGKPQNRSNDN